MKHPLVSIIMPVKNAAAFIDQSFDSVVRQSYGNWELIAVDDNSTDGSMKQMEKYESYNPRIKVLETTSDGIIPALDLAFKNSTGELITRMDADDIMPVNKLENFVKHFRFNEKMVLTGKVNYFSDQKVSDGYRRYEKWLNEIVDDDMFVQNIYRECVVASPNWMVERSCFEKDFKLVDLQYPEDYDMVFKWFENGYHFEGIDAVTHLWREHPDRTSRLSENYQQRAFFELKTMRFIKHFKDSIQNVQLIGGGPKGKLIKEILERNNVVYKWFDLNPKREDQRSVMELENKLTILSNWPTDERIQDDIRKFLRKMNLKFGDQVWLF